MHHNRRRYFTGVLLAALVVLISFSPQMRSFFSLPPMVKISVGDQLGLNLNLPDCLLNSLNVEVKTKPENILGLNNKLNSLQRFLEAGERPLVKQPGKIDLTLKLFGIISVKNVAVDVVPQLRLIPGGHSIGVLLRTQGVMVVGYSPVIDQNNKNHFPAKEAGLEIGDLVREIDGKPVNTDEGTAKLINQLGEKGKSLNLTVQRDNSNFKVNVTPIFCKETNRYRIGLYIRDSAAGVGTLTFYDPETEVYGALGHVIADAETNQQIAHGEGRIINASIQGIQQAKRGQPGEKIGVFIESQKIFGDIERNTSSGIFGTLKSSLTNDLYANPLPVALGSQVQTGPAEILTVISGEKIERFSIEIAKVMPQHLPSGKNLIINITDQRLLELTGGIVQGMSGSPIIQNGKIVGAVTHVFVNEPAKGFGILAEWMLMETDLLKKGNKLSKGAAQPLYFFSQKWGKKSKIRFF